MNLNISSKFILCSIGVFLCILLESYKNSLYTIGFINLISLIGFLYVAKRIQGKFLSPFVIIATCMYIFHSGHIWLALFNPSPYKFLTSFDWEYRTTNIEYILLVYKRITEQLILFVIVGLTFIKPIKKGFSTSHEFSYKATKLFKIIFAILYIVAMYFELRRAMSVATTSYGEGYLYGSTFAQYVVSAVNIMLLLFMYVYRHDKKQFNIYLSLLLIRTFFIMFFVGNRGTSVIYLIITMFMLATYSYASSDSKKIRKIFVSGLLFMLVFLPFISATRGATRQNIGIANFVSENNPIESFLDEFGGTAANVFLTEDYVNAVGQTNGMQILGTTLTLFPGSTALFGDIIMENISIGNKLNEFNNRQGLGGSLISQLWFNFGNGWMLYVSIILVSLLVAWTSNQLTRDGQSLLYMLFLLCLFSGLMTWVRGEWYDVITQVKMCIYIIILIKICNNKLITKYE